MKKIVSVLLSLSIIFGLFTGLELPAYAGGAVIDGLERFDYGSLKYVVIDSEAWIVECDENISGHFDIPSEIDGYNVTAIYYGFDNCTELESIFIPNSITRIDMYAFADCCSLASIDIPNSVTSIGAYAFKNCTSLTSITIPDSVTSVGCSFWGCTSLESVTIGNGVTSIGSYMFAWCESLTNIIMPNSIKTIESSAFKRCWKLTDIYYAGTKTEWNAINIDTEENDYLLKAKIHFGGIGHEHNYDSMMKPATCTESGYITYVCAECGDSYNVNMPAAGHSDTNSDRICDVCGETLAPRIELNVTNAEVGKELTVTITGKYVKGLEDTDMEFYFDNEYLEFVKVTTSGDFSMDTAGVPSDGQSVNVSLVWLNSAEKDFTINITFKALKAGTTVITPSIRSWDGLQYPVYHSLTITITEESHTHDYVEANKVEATCTESGYTTYVCSICGDSYDVTMPAAGHTEVTDEAVVPTCTENGLTEGIHCEVCGEVILAQEEVSATGHTEVTDEAVVPTCTENGLAEGAHCEVCGEVILAQEEVPATGHTEVTDEAVAPTCTENGLTEGIHCEVCGEVILAQGEVPATGHAYAVAVTKEATCTSRGEETYTCSVCGDSYTETIPMTEHIDSDNNGACDICGEVLITDCSCNCHSTSSFVKFFYKLARFFWKLFGMENKRFCACGAAHW